MLLRNHVIETTWQVARLATCAASPDDPTPATHMLLAMLALLWPPGTAAQETVCVTGFVMDTFCIERGAPACRKRAAMLQRMRCHSSPAFRLPCGRPGPIHSAQSHSNRSHAPPMQLRTSQRRHAARKRRSTLAGGRRGSAAALVPLLARRGPVHRQRLRDARGAAA